MPSFLAVFSVMAFAAFNVFAEAETVKSGELLAYGTNISGLPVFYANGFAYIGKYAPANASVVGNITVSVESTGTISIATSNSSSSNLTSSTLYIDTSTSDSGLHSVGFLSSPNTSSSANTTNANFTLFGTFVYNKSGSELQSQWYARAVAHDAGTTAQTWELLWNEDNAASDGATPVVMKLHDSTESEE